MHRSGGVGAYPHENEDAGVEDEIEEPSKEVEEEWEKGIPPFVRKLTKMVGENSVAIDWTPAGSFLVKDIDSFSAVLLPKYFKSIKFCSFVRQLNMYNFHKVEDPPNSTNKSMEFRNSHFLPGRKDLLKKIQRRKTVKRGKEEEEPDKSPKAETAPSPIQLPLLEITRPSLDEASVSYKSLLHVVLKLQQQQDVSNMALKSVLDELSYLRKANQDLELKLHQLTLQMQQQQHPSNVILPTPQTYPYSSSAVYASSPAQSLSQFAPNGAPTSTHSLSRSIPSSSYVSTAPLLSGSTANQLFSSTNGTSHLPTYPSTDLAYLFTDELSNSTDNTLNISVNMNGSANGVKRETFDLNHLQRQLNFNEPEGGRAEELLLYDSAFTF